jgi:hypothetical protein
MRLPLLVFFFLSVLTLSYGEAENKPGSAVSDGKVYPVPPVSNESLFYVQRTSNTNTIVYDLNIGADGKLNSDEPVKVYWIKYAEDGQKQGLSYIQRKFAYGLTSKPLNNGNYDIRFVSYKKFPLTLMKAGDGKYHIFAVVAQKQIIVNRIFVKIEGGTFWIPNVTSVEVKGSDPITGREIVEHFKP